MSNEKWFEFTPAQKKGASAKSFIPVGDDDTEIMTSKQLMSPSVEKYYSKVSKITDYGSGDTASAGNPGAWHSTAYSFKNSGMSVPSGYPLDNFAFDPPIQSPYSTTCPTPIPTPSTQGTYYNPPEPCAPPLKMWTHEMAKPIINWLQLVSRNFGYHLCLGGSVLNQGSSSKDLDLYFLPLGSHSPTNPGGLIQWLESGVGKLEPIGNTYPGSELPYIYKGKSTVFFSGSQRVDIFIMGSAEDAEKVAQIVPVLVELSGQNIEHQAPTTKPFEKITYKGIEVTFDDDITF